MAPVGGNPGTTLGEQRFNVYRYVANIWEAAIQSPVTITVSAGWEALTCTATCAVLGSAGAWNIWHDFPGGVPGTWYPAALANKLAGMNLTDGIPDDGSGFGNVDIKTQFNVNLGKPGCLDNTPFYLGLDGNAGSQVNFAATLLHELGHGLGFSVLTVQTSTGFRVNAAGTAFVANGGLPSIWEGFMFDNTANKTWLVMTSAERQASAINPLKLAWIGPQGVAAALRRRSASTPSLRVETPVPGIPGFYDYNTASFGPLPTNPGAFGTLAVVPADAVNGAGCAAVQPGGCRRGPRQDRDDRSRRLRLRGQGQERAERRCLRRDHRQQRGRWRRQAWAAATRRSSIPTVSVSQAQGTILKQAVADAVKYGCARTARFGGGQFRVRRLAQGGRRPVGPAAAVHAEPARRWFVGIALGRDRVPQPADGAEHQRGSDHLVGAAAGPHASLAEGPRLVSRNG